MTDGTQDLCHTAIQVEPPPRMAPSRDADKRVWAGAAASSVAMHLSGRATKRALFGLAGIDSGCALPSDDGLTLMVAKFSQPG